jgi:hypothetical protein
VVLCNVRGSFNNGKINIKWNLYNYINATDTDLYIQGETNGDANVNFSIDNVSVKEVRASSVEAVKCLADAIHRIGIQNIQN